MGFGLPGRTARSQFFKIVILLTWKERKKRKIRKFITKNLQNQWVRIISIQKTQKFENSLESFQGFSHESKFSVKSALKCSHASNGNKFLISKNLQQNFHFIKGNVSPPKKKRRKTNFKCPKSFFLSNVFPSLLDFVPKKTFSKLNIYNSIVFFNYPEKAAETTFFSLTEMAHENPA